MRQALREENESEDSERVTVRLFTGNPGRGSIGVGVFTARGLAPPTGTLHMNSLNA